MADIFFIIFALCVWPVGIFILWKIPYPVKTDDGKIESQSASVIVPARDEEKRLPLLLTSLQHQTVQPDEILVVDDDSTGGTAAVANLFNVGYLEAENKPLGWVGKSWACWSGAKKAKNPVLIFLDADVVLEEDGLEKVLSTYWSEEKAVAIQPYHMMKRPYEFLSAFFNIIVVAGLGPFTLAGNRIERAGMFGPCLVCSQQEYFDAGGHEAVKGDVVEDIALGKKFRQAGYDFALYGGKGSVAFRMYPEGFRSMIQGWTKSMAAGAGTTTRLPLFSILWISGATVVFVMILRTMVVNQDLGVLFWSVLIYILYAGQVQWMLRRIGNFGFFTAILFPVHLMFFHILFIRSSLLTLFKKEITWKGRDTRSGVS